MSSPGKVVMFQYDKNGNQTKRTEGTNITNYGYSSAKSTVRRVVKKAKSVAKKVVQSVSDVKKAASEKAEETNRKAEEKFPSNFFEPVSETFSIKKKRDRFVVLEQTNLSLFFPEIIGV